MARLLHVTTVKKLILQKPCLFNSNFLVTIFVYCLKNYPTATHPVAIRAGDGAGPGDHLIHLGIVGGIKPIGCDGAHNQYARGLGCDDVIGAAGGQGQRAVCHRKSCPAPAVVAPGEARGSAGFFGVDS